MSGDKQRLIQKAKDEPKIYGDYEDVGYDKPKEAVNENVQQAELGESSQSNVSQPDIKDAAKLPQYIATITATLSALAAGTVLAWTSPITLDLEHGRYHNISIDNTQMGWIGSLVTVGAMTMCFPFGFICDLIGRRAALLLLIIPYSVGWSLIIWAKSLLMLYIGRFITGMAAGACCVGAPLYTSEIAHKEIRGTLGSYFQLMVTIGIFFAYTVGKFTTPTHYTVICAIIPFVFFILFVFQPESPLYSLKKAKVETARNDLVRLRGPLYNVDTELDQIKRALEASSQNSVSIFNSLQRRAAKKALIIALALMFFQQLSGINAIIFYTGDIFTASGSKLDPHTATILVGGFQAVTTFISSLIVDRLGRRMLLIGSDFIMAFSIIFLGLFFTLKDRHLVAEDTLTTVLGFLPVASLCIFVIMFSLGLGPIPWTISGEMFTPELKSFAAASVGTFNWFLAFLVTKFYLQLEIEIGSDVMFYIFSVICFCGALFSYLIVPETKGKTVEQVQKDLEG